MRFILPICPGGLLLQGLTERNLLNAAICDSHRTSDFRRKRRTLSKSTRISSYKYENYLTVKEKKELVVIQLNFVRVDYTTSHQCSETIIFAVQQYTQHPVSHNYFKNAEARFSSCPAPPLLLPPPLEAL